MSVNQNLSFAGLGTFTTIMPVAGPYILKGKLSLPTIVGGGGQSAAVVTVNQNGAPIYVGQPGAEGFLVAANAAANDTFTIVTTSAADPDLVLNAVKATYAISSGVS
jgi:hypothetical protein